MSEQKRSTKKVSRAGKIISAAGTGAILAVIALCSMLVIPGFFGYQMYHVLSGSMEPELPVGSLIYVEKGQPEDVADGEVIAFYASTDGGGIITHRAKKNHVVSGTFTTKGDANEKEDPTPVSYDSYIGTVRFSIPHLGKALTYLTSAYGKAVAACVVLLGAVLNFLGSKISKK